MRTEIVSQTSLVCVSNVEAVKASKRIQVCLECELHLLIVKQRDMNSMPCKVLALRDPAKIVSFGISECLKQCN